MDMEVSLDKVLRFYVYVLRGTPYIKVKGYMSILTAIKNTLHQAPTLIAGEIPHPAS